MNKVYRIRGKVMNKTKILFQKMERDLVHFGTYLHGFKSQFRYFFSLGK